MSSLISAADLAAALDRSSPPLLLDVSWLLGGPPGIETYRAGHIPGARFVDLAKDLAGPRTPSGAEGRHPLPEPAAFGAAMRRLGVGPGTEVVVYDSRNSIAAARAWWLLRHHGHDRVRVLDGGLAAWAAAGLPVTDVEPPPAEPGTFMPCPGMLPKLDADEAVALVESGGVLLDARAAERFRGETEPIDAKAGHIPGAVSAPATDYLRADGRFREPAELKEHFAALGAVHGVRVGAYCGSGTTAAHEVLALSVAGVPAALYAGSWSDWISDPTRPVAIGA
ncbi:sulfurtransferase [Embleya sp. NBC_00896]|uniref:sulfurtransferase n=1 Tax=Embleya sp. NBC_00896 TaxID=2975961 RepID=UPI003865CD6B|nr:sulfurtransferase [Embleya sp. NBC_00896]